MPATVYAIVRLEALEELLRFAEEHIKDLTPAQLSAGQHLVKVVQQRRAADAQPSST